MNWAVTIDLNPVALLPSACIPFIPKTDLNEQLKIYGDAELTVSEPTVTVAVSKNPTAGKKSRGVWLAMYLNVLTPTTSLTVNEPLYDSPSTVTPLTRNGLSTYKLWGKVSPVNLFEVVTVISFKSPVPLPLPALILLIPNGLASREPTILNSSTEGSKSSLTG